MCGEEELLKEFYNTREVFDKEQFIEEKTKKIEELKSFSYTQTKEEKELYERFCEIANKDSDQKFKFEHIEALGVNADVVVIYGKKGIGKTYQISKIIDDISKEDSKAEVILLRNTVSEFQALEKQLSVRYCPVYMKSKNSNNPQLFHKWMSDDNDKPRYMGFCASLSGFSLESAKGAEYPNIRLIIWDECTNMGTGNAGYDKVDIDRFITFFDSIIRSKTNVKIYIFGNFHRNTDGKVSDVLLDYLKIPLGCTLKIREAKSHDLKNISRFLYINTGALYSGIDSNAKVTLFGGATIQDDLFTNLPKSYSNMVGGLNIFYGHKPEMGYLFNNGEETYILLLSSFTTMKSMDTVEINWMIHMELFPTVNDFVHDIVTADVGLYNEFSSYGIDIFSEQEERLFIHDLYEICLNQSLYFSSDVTRTLFKKQITRWQEKYNLGITVSFKANKRKKIEGF